MNHDAAGSKARKSKAAKTTKGKGAERLKCSLLLTRENDLRLTVLASVKMTDRSTLLNQILDDALRGVVVSLRGQLATDNGAGEGGPDEGETEVAKSEAASG